MDGEGAFTRQNREEGTRAGSPGRRPALLRRCRADSPGVIGQIRAGQQHAVVQEFCACASFSLMATVPLVSTWSAEGVKAAQNHLRAADIQIPV
jgi:hypothetical protein